MDNAKKRVDPVDARSGGPFSPGIVAEGRFVFVSGQGAFRDGQRVVGTIEDETRLALDNLAHVLEAAGAPLDDVVRCNVYLADLADAPAMNAVYESVFRDPRPARTTVGAALLGDMKIEIDCIAVLPSA
jgi:2-iminobutanoate/2-iminopropanoate deaminase